MKIERARYVLTRHSRSEILCRGKHSQEWIPVCNIPPNYEIITYTSYKAAHIVFSNRMKNVVSFLDACHVEIVKVTESYIACDAS